MKKRILCAILSLVAVFSLIGLNATQTWFSGGENKGMTLDSGELDFQAEGSFSYNAVDSEGNAVEVLPGAELKLENPITIKNNSSIDSELRIKIECEYTKKDENGSDVTDENGAVVKENASWASFILADGETNWNLVEENDGYTYIYYCPNGDGRIEPSHTDFTFNSNLKIIGEKAGIEMSGRDDIQIKLVLQAKQADFMKWENFYNEAGLPTIETPATDNE